MPCGTPLRLAVALDGTGWHPASWQDDQARPREAFSAAYWTELVQESERAKLDFVTIEDSFTLQSSRFEGPDHRVDEFRGRLDAALIASRVAPVTNRIGLIPTVTTRHTEPFHVSTAIATLDYVSSGRAGWRVQVGHSGEESLFGRREPSPFTLATMNEPAAQQAIQDRFDEAGDSVEAVRRLWDSWEDDAVIRDEPTGRFIDRDKLHYTDFEGRWFSVRGPSITPRPPQGQPVVAALAHSTVPYRFAVRSADVVFITPFEDDDVRAIVATVRAEQAAAEASGVREPGRPLRIFADLNVFLAGSATAAVDRKARLDELSGREFTSDAATFTGTPTDLARRLVFWQSLGLDGFRLRPASVPHDLTAITRGLVPELKENDSFRRDYEATTLRALLGLPRPTGRYTGSTGSRTEVGA